MYKAFYSLAKTPFSKEISVDSMYKFRSFEEGLARLEYLKNSRGIGVIVGDPGSGKTTLMRKFTGSLNQSLYKVIYFPLSTVSASDFYRGLAYGLGETPKFKKVDLFAQIQTTILNLYKNQKITPVIMLDEMQMASNQFLNDISLLFNFSMDSENPFILCITGLTYFIDKLKLVQLQPLNQRIIIRHQMSALNKDEVGQYIEHQMKLAGANHTIFSPEAIEAIASRSGGRPRVINNLASHCLIYGCTKNLQIIDSEAVYAASSEVGL